MKFRQIIFSSIFWRGLYYFTAFLVNIIISRYFQAEGSGLIYYITNYFSFILLLGSLCLESGMSFFASQQSISENKLASLSLLWSAVVSLLIILLLFFYPNLVTEKINQPEFLFFSCTYLPGILLTTYFSSLFYAQHRYALPGILLFISNLLLIVCVPVFIYYNKQNGHKIFLNVYFFTFLLQGIALCIAYLVKNKLFTRWVLPTYAELKLLFRYSLMALFINVLFFLLYRIDYWFVKNMCPVCNEGDLGNYIQVSKIGQLFLLLPTIIASAIFPRTASGFKEQVNRWLPILAKTIFLLYVLLLTFLTLVGKWLFPWMYGESFNHMYVAFILLIPGILSLSTIALITAYNAGKNKVKTNMKGSLIGLAVIGLGDWWLIPSYGINAAAGVSSAGYVGYLIYLLYVFKKEYRVAIKAFFIPVMADKKRLKEIFSFYEKN